MSILFAIFVMGMLVGLIVFLLAGLSNEIDIAFVFFIVFLVCLLASVTLWHDEQFTPYNVQCYDESGLVFDGLVLEHPIKDQMWEFADGELWEFTEPGNICHYDSLMEDSAD